MDEFQIALGAHGSFGGPGEQQRCMNSPTPPCVVGQELATKRLKDEAGILPSHLVLQLTSYRPDVRLLKLVITVTTKSHNKGKQYERVESC